jgi:hypothetical protein
MVSSGMLRHVALVRIDVSEEPSASIRVTRIGELGTTLAATSNPTHAVKKFHACHPDEGGARFLRNAGYYKSHAA